MDDKDLSKLKTRIERGVRKAQDNAAAYPGGLLLCGLLVIWLGFTPLALTVWRFR